MSIEQNDPGELLEVFDASGQPTGQARSRAQVHLEGDWHQAFHCWIVRHNAREVVLQQRSRRKDTFPGCWDAAAAGHWRFGETPEQAAREIAEELGLEVPFGELLYRGREESSHEFANGLIDREHHQVYVLNWDKPLDEYHPDWNEVIGLAAFGVADVLALREGRLLEIPARESIVVDRDGSVHRSQVVVRQEDLVPYSPARLRRMLGSL